MVANMDAVIIPPMPEPTTMTSQGPSGLFVLQMSRREIFPMELLLPVPVK